MKGWWILLLFILLGGWGGGYGYGGGRTHESAYPTHACVYKGFRAQNR